MTEREQKMAEILNDMQIRAGAAIKTLKSTSAFKKNSDKQIREIIRLGNQLQITLDIEGAHNGTYRRNKDKQERRRMDQKSPF